jgi:predicted small secreted protein
MKDWLIMFGIKIALVSAVVATSLLTACSTVAGVGTDIKGAADWTHEKMTGDKVKL